MARPQSPRVQDCPEMEDGVNNEEWQEPDQLSSPPQLSSNAIHNSEILPAHGWIFCDKFKEFFQLFSAQSAYFRSILIPFCVRIFRLGGEQGQEAGSRNTGNTSCSWGSWPGGPDWVLAPVTSICDHSQQGGGGDPGSQSSVSAVSTNTLIPGQRRLVGGICDNSRGPPANQRPVSGHVIPISQSEARITHPIPGRVANNHSNFNVDCRIFMFIS